MEIESWRIKNRTPGGCKARAKTSRRSGYFGRLGSGRPPWLARPAGPPAGLRPFLTMHLTLRRSVPLLLLPFGCAVSAFAQAVSTGSPATPAKPGDTVKLEAFTVTGSNFKRLDQENVLPVTVFNIEAMEVRNALTPVEMLTALPQITNVPLNETQNGGANSRGDNANVNLRGIGAGSTLVLLNGRRVAPHPITSNDGGVPAFYSNVNQLPTQGLERIDVVVLGIERLDHAFARLTEQAGAILRHDGHEPTALREIELLDVEHKGTHGVTHTDTPAAGSRGSTRYSRTMSPSAALVAMTSPPNAVSRPRQSVKRPPASVISGYIAAASHGLTMSSIMASARPVATNR